MRAFDYSRGRRGRRRARGADAAVEHALPRRRHQPARPDERRRRAAGAPRRHHAPAAAPDIEALPDGGLRIGALVRNSDAGQPSRWCARAIRCSSQALLCRRVAAAAQHGDDRRQPAAAHALPLLPRHRIRRVQQARRRAPAARRAKATTASTRSSARATQCIATHPSDMCVALAALDAVVRSAQRGRRARESRWRDFHRLPGDTPRARHRPRRGELITARRCCRRRRSRRTRTI